MPSKTTKNFRIWERQDDAVEELADKYGVDRSKIVRRAIDMYSQFGHKRDKVLKNEINGSDSK